MSLTEKENLDVATILCVGVVSVGLTLTAVVGVQALYASAARVQFERKVLQVTHSASDSALAEQEAKLASYAWVDRSAGRVSIPIDRAMQLEVERQRGRQAQQQQGNHAAEG